MKLFLLPVAALASRSVSLAADLSVMKDTLRSIVADSKKSGEPISQQTRITIEQMLSSIENSVGAALGVDRTTAQGELDTALAAANECKSDRTTQFDTDVLGKTQGNTDAETKFHACKVGESGVALLGKQDPSHPNFGGETHETHDFGYNSTRVWHADAHWSHTSHEVHAHSVEHELCSKLNTTVKGFTAKVKRQNDDDYCLPEMNPECGELQYNFYEKLETSETWFSHMDSFESTEAASYKQERDDCHRARQRHVERREECSRLQTLFEQAACAEANEIDEECHYYKDCYDTMEAEWAAIKGQVIAKEVQFKKQQHALEILRCYGNQIMAGTTDLSLCDAATADCQGCEPTLDIVYEDPHTFIPCTEAKNTNRPCHNSWYTTSYGPYFKSDTPVCDCVACSQPSLGDFVSPNAPSGIM